MSVLKIGNIDVVPWLTEYNLQLIPQFGSNGFTAENGDVISDYKGDKIAVSFTLRRVPDDVAKQISTIIGSKEFSCTVSAPCTITDKFVKTSYKAMPYEKSAKWHFDISLESAALINSGSGL
ncbi:MAG: hypothetical protein IJ368_00360 [Oscillospiraceae bacterium]|nr:hypothetical protein [Oscillospiraceae bacterium]